MSKGTITIDREFIENHLSLLGRAGLMFTGVVGLLDSIDELREIVDKSSSSIIFPERKPASMANEFQLAEEWYEELGYNQAIDDIKRLNGIE